MKRANEPSDQLDETSRDEPSHTVDERDALTSDLNDALLRWLAEFDEMEEDAA